MDIIIKSVNFKTSVDLEKFIREKVSKLHDHYDNIIGPMWFFANKKMAVLKINYAKSN